MFDRVCSKCQEFKKASEFNLSGGNQCKICVRKRIKKWQDTNPKKVANYKRNYSAANPEKEKIRKRIYRKANPEKTNAITAKRRAAKLQRTMVFDQDGIEFHYRLAILMSIQTGNLWTVDHRIPLQGKYVSGLHVAENLQVMLGSVNDSKGNLFKINST